MSFCLSLVPYLPKHNIMEPLKNVFQPGSTHHCSITGPLAWKGSLANHLYHISITCSVIFIFTFFLKIFYTCYIVFNIYCFDHNINHFNAYTHSHHFFLLLDLTFLLPTFETKISFTFGEFQQTVWGFQYRG